MDANKQRRWPFYVVVLLSLSAIGGYFYYDWSFRSSIHATYRFLIYAEALHVYYQAFGELPPSLDEAEEFFRNSDSRNAPFMVYSRDERPIYRPADGSFEKPSVIMVERERRWELYRHVRRALLFKGGHDEIQYPHVEQKVLTRSEERQLLGDEWEPE